MGILALPNATIRSLGACQVVNDPATVVKELLDNALDAQATSVTIEISNNTVDSIQIRDNGHGIQPGDRQLVARPHCTSKIGSEDDLKSIGGTSLGFRGEALASIAELSDSLTISTRVEGEQVAVALNINQQGEVVSQERASFPVGTTVKITAFVKAYPVRNQNALKNSEKCLKSIKQTLQSYAFARPEVRLSLRVTKTKSDKANWAYAPKAGGNAEDAAFKIAGAACASQCIWSVIDDHGFTFRAFLPKLDADPSKIGNAGSFLSIDGRPVSAARGTPKQIVKIFRETMKKGNSNFDGVKEPFIYLNISCPVSSYDANVEPAKDDVLFENPESVIQAVRRLFHAVYPPQEQQSSAKQIVHQSSVHNSRNRQSLAAADDFFTSLDVPNNDILSSRVADHIIPSRIPDTTLEDLVNQWQDGQSQLEEALPKQVFRTNMYGCDEEDLDLIEERSSTGRAEADVEEFRQARKDINISNPWALARMHAASRRPAYRPNEESEGSDNCLLSTNTLYPAPEHEFAERSDDTPNLPTPRPSSPSPPTQCFMPRPDAANVRSAADGRRFGPEYLPPPQTVIAPASFFSGGSENTAPETQSHRQPPAYDYTLSSQTAELSAGTPLHAIPDVGRSSRRSPKKRLQQTQINNPFVSPLKDRAPKEKVWFDHLEQGLGRQQRPKRARPYQQTASNGLVNQGELGDLVEDPCPLTPPRRNRDMRDFISHVDPTDSENAASLIKSRGYAGQKRSHSAAAGNDSASKEPADETPAANILDSSGFVRASELAFEESRSKASAKTPQGTSKRRKVSDARAMLEISGNARTQYGDDEYFPPMIGTRTASRRRRTTDGSKSRRTTSFQLPLERTPAGQGTQNILVYLATSSREIQQQACWTDQGKSWLGWSESTMDAYDAFTMASENMHDLTARLHDVLVNRVSDGQMVQDLGVLVQNAMTACEKA